MAAARTDRCPHPEEAYVSLATNDHYANGALVLGQSLRRANVSRKLTLLVTKDVSHSARVRLHEIWDEVITIEPLDSEDSEHLALMARPELGVTFTKLKIWTLTQYKKCVFLDADILILQNIDELFEREELSAAPDVGWPDCFNSGVFVFVPSKDTYERLLQFAVEFGSFDGGDQGLLNMFFKDWASQGASRRLPFVYNMVSNVTYSYAPAFKMFGKDVKVVHFLGAVKPWHHYCDETTGEVIPISSSSSKSQNFIQAWWDIYREVIGSSEAEDNSTGDSSGSAWIGGDRETAWKHGHIDYLGEDKFENIQRHLDEVISGKSVVNHHENTGSYYTLPVENVHYSCDKRDHPWPFPSIEVCLQSNSQPISEEQTHYSDGGVLDQGQVLDHRERFFQAAAEASRHSSEHSGASRQDAESATTSYDDDANRRGMWERGQIDYLGKDRFDNILEHLRLTVGENLVVHKKEPPLADPSVIERRLLRRRARKMLKRMEEKKAIVRQLSQSENLSYEERVYLAAQRLAKEMASKMARRMATRMAKELAKEKAKRIARSMIKKYISKTRLGSGDYS